MKGTRSSLKSFEPRVLVSGGKAGRWSAAGKSLDEALCTGVQSWVYAFNGDYIGHRDLVRQDLDRYDIAIINTNKPLAPLVHLAQDRPRSLAWVSLIEGGADDYCVPQDHVKALLDSSDLVNTINRHSLPLFRRLTTSKVEFIGMPYPVAGVRKLATPIENRKRRIFLCTQLSRRWNEHLAAKEIGVAAFGHDLGKPREGILTAISRAVQTGSLSREKEDHVEKTRRIYADPVLDIRLFTKDLKKYLAENGDACFWMDLDNRHTWSRFVLDAAALSVPIIATASTGHAEVLFPLTTVADVMDLDRVVEIGKRLAGEQDFSKHVALFSAEKLESFTAEAMKRALLDALGTPRDSG